MKKIFVCLFAALTMGLAMAQAEQEKETGPNWPDIRKTGQLFTIRLVPGSKESKLFVDLAGHNAAAVKGNKVSVEASYGFGKFRKNLTVTRTDDNQFVIKTNQAKKIRLRLKSGERSESFPINLD